MKTLEMFDGTDNSIGNILGDAWLNWDDNGDAADGNAWFPNVWVADDLTEQLMEEAAQAGLGKIVEVETADSDNEMRAILGLPQIDYYAAERDEEEEWEELREAANAQLEWARYGGGLTWVFVKKGQ